MDKDNTFPPDFDTQEFAPLTLLEQGDDEGHYHSGARVDVAINCTGSRGKCSVLGL